MEYQYESFFALIILFFYCFKNNETVAPIIVKN